MIGTMNLIADEDDLLEARANEILLREAAPLGTSREEGFLIARTLLKRHFEKAGLA